VSEFGDALGAVLLVGAAREACKGPAMAGHRRRLLALGQPLFASSELGRAMQRGDYAEVERLVRGVMPAGWQPAPAWRLADRTEG
jgi:hypothetical protein